MQRVAAIYDIHGNLPALEAVLDDIRREGVDRVVVGGDALPGPMPRETLDCLFNLDVPIDFIRGNGDRIVRDAYAGVDDTRLPVAVREAVRWVAQQLGPADMERIGAWAEMVGMPIGDLGYVLFCHATPRNDTEVFTRATPEERLLKIFEREAAVVVCGHTHMQFDRMVGGVRVVNAGSVGMPYGEPGAYWLLLGPGVELRRTQYDLESAAARMLATHYPNVRAFVENDLLHPRSEREMIELFSTVELK
jgi:putative phosphoesterase